VSDGPEALRFVMPDLTGRSLAAVQEWIDRSGFRRGPLRRIDAKGQEPETVVGQLPLPGYPIASKGVVEIAVAR
jgi:beta-lactam-binding protein with PASTA domain